MGAGQEDTTVFVNNIIDAHETARFVSLGANKPTFCQHKHTHLTTTLQG